MKEKCLTFCFIELKAKVSPKWSGEGGLFCAEVRSLLSKLIFTFSVSCRSRSDETVEKETTTLSPETEQTSRLTNSRTILDFGS